MMIHVYIFVKIFFAQLIDLFSSLECVTIETYGEGFSYTVEWALGASCNLNGYYQGEHEQECCFAPGAYTLTCKDDYGDGWADYENGKWISGAYVRICNEWGQCQKYCDDWYCTEQNRYHCTLWPNNYYYEHSQEVSIIGKTL